MAIEFDDHSNLVKSCCGTMKEAARSGIIATPPTRLPDKGYYLGLSTNVNLPAGQGVVILCCPWCGEEMPWAKHFQPITRCIFDKCGEEER